MKSIYDYKTTFEVCDDCLYFRTRTECLYGGGWHYYPANPNDKCQLSDKLPKSVRFGKREYNKIK